MSSTASSTASIDPREENLRFPHDRPRAHLDYTVDFESQVNLADSTIGAAIIYVNDDFFAAAKNLLKPTVPVWDADRFTSNGKWSFKPTIRSIAVDRLIINALQSNT
jgi:allantoicase